MVDRAGATTSDFHRMKIRIKNAHPRLHHESLPLAYTWCGRVERQDLVEGVHLSSCARQSSWRKRLLPTGVRVSQKEGSGVKPA